VGRSILRLNKKYLRHLNLIFLSVDIVVFCIFATYFLFYNGKIYPNINVGGIDISNLSSGQASSLLASKISIPQKIQLYEDNHEYTINPNDFDFTYDFSDSAQIAFNITRTGNFFYDFSERTFVFFQPVNLGLSVSLNNDKLDKIISVISNQISEVPIEPSITLINGDVVIGKGAPGTEVNKSSLKALIEDDLTFAKNESIEIPIESIDHSLSQTEMASLKNRAEKYVGKSLQIKFEDNTFTLSDSDLLKLVDLKSGFNKQAIETIFSDISVKVNRDPQNPKFVFDNGKVTEFQPALDGIQIDNNEFKNQIIIALTQIENNTDKTVSFDLPVLRNPPEVSTESVNNLGIKELIGRGTSTYFHSIPGRVHNVVLAASRINGTLVAPGETFSFNNTLGDVSAFTGYQQAYIISGGKTILGDGGGVCQVSTTLFRAVLNSGLPIVERAAHAYRVGYYEQDSPPGLDATVYAPSPDLKFTNNTPGYVLIEATANPKNYSLVFELYGTSDGRVATISKPVISNYLPALPTVYQDDPTLPAGTLKQTDFSASGATVKFNYTVTRAGQTIFQKTFVSNYQPWAAVYLRGTGPAN
jgi:vancomycin resistance protein YoaR